MKRRHLHVHDAQQGAQSTRLFLLTNSAYVHFLRPPLRAVANLHLTLSNRQLSALVGHWP
jgi:hypothetical protein